MKINISEPRLFENGSPPCGAAAGERFQPARRLYEPLIRNGRAVNLRQAEVHTFLARNLHRNIAELLRTWNVKSIKSFAKSATRLTEDGREPLMSL
jgi:hypothetical protein